MEEQKMGGGEERKLLRVGRLQNSQLSEFLEYEESGSPERVVLAHFVETTLAEQQGSDIYTGDIFVRMKVGVTEATLSIFEQLLEPFEGNFRMGFWGTYVLKPNYADVSCLTVPTAYLQPRPGVGTASTSLAFDEVKGVVVGG